MKWIHKIDKYKIRNGKDHRRKTRDKKYLTRTNKRGEKQNELKLNNFTY